MLYRIIKKIITIFDVFDIGEKAIPFIWLFWYIGFLFMNYLVFEMKKKNFNTIEHWPQILYMDYSYQNELNGILMLIREANQFQAISYS